MPGRFYESDNGKSEEFPSCYLYFLNEVRNEVLCESEGKEKLCKMWSKGREYKIITLTVAQFTREILYSRVVPSAVGS